MSQCEASHKNSHGEFYCIKPDDHAGTHMDHDRRTWGSDAGATAYRLMSEYIALELNVFCAGIRRDDEYSQGYKRAIERMRDVLDEVHP